MTILELSNWTSPELLTWAVANAVVVNKSAGKAALMAAVMAHKHGPDGSITIYIKTHKGTTTFNVADGDTIDLVQTNKHNRLQQAKQTNH